MKEIEKKIMIPLKDSEWAINRRREILVGLEVPGNSEVPMAFVIRGNDGYVAFENAEVVRIDIPKEILVSIAAAADILIVSLRGGAIIAERRVSISRG